MGEQADATTTSGETATASIRVTDETAAPGGKRSLKFTDAPGLPKAHWPWLSYAPKRSEVTLHFSFDLRVEDGSSLIHEWRTPGSTYKVGPSLRIDSGVVTVAGKALTTLPPAEWVHFEIVAPVSEENPGVFEMIISGPQVTPQRFGGLPFGSGKEFVALGWLGFISVAETETAFFLDNAILRAEEARTSAE